MKPDKIDSQNVLYGTQITLCWALFHGFCSFVLRRLCPVNEVKLIMPIKLHQIFICDETCFSWDQTLAFAFLLYHLRRLVKNWTSYFITGSKHLETNESSRPIASCFHLSLGVWNPWWSTCPRSWHTTSNTVWLQTSQRFSFFFSFHFLFFLDRWQVKVHVSVKFPAEVDSLSMYIFKRFDGDCKNYHSLAHPKKVSRLQENIFGGLKKKTLW